MSSAASLDSPVAKIERAIEHYRALKERFLDGLDRRLLPVETRISPDGLVYQFCCEEIVPLDHRFATVLGDGFYNLRCALDHLVYQLHVLELGSPLTEAIERDSAFPVIDNRLTKNGKPIDPPPQWKAIKNLSPTLQSGIDELQRYHGWNDHNMSPRPLVSQMRQTLHEVNWFNLRDKHREIHFAEYMPFVVFGPPSFLDTYGVKTEPAFGKPLATGSVVDTWTFDTRPDGEFTNPGFYSAVAVEPNPGDRVDVVQSLGGSIHGVTPIIRHFANFFPNYQSPDLSDVVQTQN